MHHHFDVDIAVKYGMVEAVLLENLYFWIAKNEANGKHFHDGSTWTYNSTRAFHDLFPYVSVRTIQNALQRLRDAGIIKVGNFNENPMDRTLWYAITESGMRLLKRENDFPKKGNADCDFGKAIPDNKHTDNKPDINLSISDEIDCCTDEQRCVDAWNALGLSKVVKLDPESKRALMLNKRIKDYGVDAVVQAIESVASSDFLMGKTKAHFKLTFDWLVKPNNFPKVLEGNYLNGHNDIPHTEPAYKMARYFAKAIKDRLPSLPDIQEDTVQKWATVMQEINAEGHDWDEIADVIDASQESQFWARNICDAYSLKRKYVNILSDLSRG